MSFNIYNYAKNWNQNSLLQEKNMCPYTYWKIGKNKKKNYSNIYMNIYFHQK